MHRPRRCLSGSALSLLLAACFSPTGSVFTTSATSETGTTAAPETTSTTSTTGTTATSTTATSPTSEPDPTTDAASSDTSATTAAATTDAGTTDTTNTTRSDTPVCGNMIVEPGEQCDVGRNNQDNGACTASCQVAVCGDTLRCTSCETLEECDDGAQVPGDGCDQNCRREGRLIFVSSTVHNGAVGLAFADGLCQDLGDTHFAPDRTFIAWLSTSTQSIGDRLNDALVPYVLPRGELVAKGTAELLSGQIAHPIDQEPSGITIAGEPLCQEPNLVWTGSTASGETAAAHCDDWTTNSGKGTAGTFKFGATQWTNFCDVDCSWFLRLYCIET